MGAITQTNEKDKEEVFNVTSIEIRARLVPPPVSVLKATSMTQESPQTHGKVGYSSGKEARISEKKAHTNRKKVMYPEFELRTAK